MELKLLENGGVIEGLELQPRFLLQSSFRYNGKTERKIEYVADFRYRVKGEKIDTVEDVKGFKTDVYKLKRKLFLFKYGDEVDFKEV